MVRAADIRAILQNLAAWLISVVLTGLAWPWLSGGDQRETTIKYTVPQAVFAVLLFLALFAVVTHIVQKARLVARTHTGREFAMAENVKLVASLCVDPSDDFLSTRVTYWDLGENSPARTRFRSLISEKLTAGHLVKRIWHLATEDDVKRLRHYLSQYANYDNYHVRVLTDLRYPVPELICVGMKGASITFPELRSPRKMNLAVQFRRKQEVEALRKYFDLLWEQATQIKNGATVSSTVLDQIADRITGTTPAPTAAALQAAGSNGA